MASGWGCAIGDRNERLGGGLYLTCRTSAGGVADWQQTDIGIGTPIIVGRTVLYGVGAWFLTRLFPIGAIAPRHGTCI